MADYVVPKSKQYFIRTHSPGKGGRWRLVFESDERRTNIVGNDFARQRAQSMINFNIELGKDVMFNGKKIYSYNKK